MRIGAVCPVADTSEIHRDKCSMVAKFSCFKMDWFVYLALLYKQTENEQFEVKKKKIFDS